MNDAAKVAAVAGSLSEAQRYHVERACISGDFTMATINDLVRKGVMHLVIDSPNGQAGFMELTPFGGAVRDFLRNQEGNGDG